MKLVIAILILQACAAEVSEDRPTRKKCMTGEEKACTASEAKIKASEKKSDDEELVDQGSAVPSYRPETLPTNFNRNIAVTPKADPADTGKVLKILRVPYYQVVWLNLRQEAWPEVAFTFLKSGIDLLSRGTGLPTFETPGADGKSTVVSDAKVIEPDHLSLFKPLPPLSADASEEGGFRLAGHTLNPDLKTPSYPTAVMAIMPGQKESVIQEPDDYHLLYSFQQPGMTYQSISAKCMNEENQKYLGMKTAFTEFCAGYLPEYLGNINNPQYQSYSANRDGYPPSSNEYRWKKYLDSMSVAIWEPIPAEGYGCLGFASSNGNKDKPEIHISNESMDNHAGMYCVRKEYLLPAKLGELLGETGDGQMAFYRLTSDNPDAYLDGNFFVAVKLEQPELQIAIRPLTISTENTTTQATATPPATTNTAPSAPAPAPKAKEYWVLNKKFIKILPDDKLIESGSTIMNTGQ